MGKRLLFLVVMLALFASGAHAQGRSQVFNLYSADSLAGATACTTQAIPIMHAKSVTFFYGARDSLLAVNDIYTDTLSAGGVQFSNDGVSWSGLITGTGAQSAFGVSLDQSIVTITSGVRQTANQGACMANVRAWGVTTTSNAYQNIPVRYCRFTMTVTSRDRATGSAADAAMYRPFIKAVVLYDSGVTSPPSLGGSGNGPRY